MLRAKYAVFCRLFWQFIQVDLPVDLQVWIKNIPDTLLYNISVIFSRKLYILAIREPSLSPGPMTLEGAAPLLSFG